MAYEWFDVNKPDIADAGSSVVDEARETVMALRDAVIMGHIASWDLTIVEGGGDAEEPDELKYSDGTGGTTEWIKAVLTWGTTGGEDGNITVEVWSYSADNESSYDTIGTRTITYDGSGNVTAEAWS